MLLLKEKYHPLKNLLCLSQLLCLSISARVNVQKSLLAYLLSGSGSLCTQVILAVVLALFVSS